MNLKNRQQVLGLIAGAAIALFAADKLLIAPLSASWKQRAARITELRQRIEEGKTLLQRESSLRSRWEQMRRNALPTGRSQVEQQVLKAFDRWSKQSNVSINSITPQWKQDADDFMTLECRVEASGSLGTVTSFLYNIEKDPMALKMQAIELSAHDNDGQQIILGLQVSGLVLTPQTKRP